MTGAVDAATVRRVNEVSQLSARLNRGRFGLSREAWDDLVAKLGAAGVWAALIGGGHAYSQIRDNHW